MRSEDEVRRRLADLESAALRPLTSFDAIGFGDPEKRERAWRRAVHRAEVGRDVLRWVMGEAGVA